MPQQSASTAPPARRGARWLAWTLLGLTIVLLAATLVIGLTGHEDWTRVVGFMPTVITLALVGTLVAARTGNRLGWLFLAAATVSAMGVLVDVYAARPLTAELPGAAWAGWTLVVSLGIVQPLLFLIPPVAVAAATLAAAALFTPVRRRVQYLVDRRFNRVRYDADRTASEFAARLRDAVDLDAIRADLLTVVNRAVEPAHLSVWIAEGGHDRH